MEIIKNIAHDLDLSLDERRTRCGTHEIHACIFVRDNERHASILKSAFHAELLDAFGSKFRIRVESTVPDMQLDMITMVKAIYMRVIDLYPWKHKVIMQTLVDHAAFQSVYNYHDGAMDPLLHKGNVDAIMPPMCHLRFTNAQQLQIRTDAMRLTGLLPSSSLFELYATVYDRQLYHDTPLLRDLHFKLFVTR